MKRWIAGLLVLVWILGCVPAGAFALETTPITDITLNRTEAKISEGAQLKLEAKIQPENAVVNQVIWTSSDPSVVRLEANGVVKAVGVGEALVTVQAGEHSASCRVTVMERLTGEKTITAPSGAAVQMFYKEKYYSYQEIDPVYSVENQDNTTTFYFSTLKSDLSWRVTQPGMTTKAGYWNGTPVVISGDTTPEQKNGSVNENGVFLNINGKNTLKLDAGEEYDLWAFRTWEIVSEITANHIIMPDFSWTILSGSNVVELVDNPAPMNGSSCSKTLVAKAEGTAIIEVGYDPIDVFGGDMSGTYPGCDSSRKGLLVVQVGGNTADVDFGIHGFSSISAPTTQGTTGYIPYNSGNKRAWDAEFDTLYFTGSTGILKFSPGGSVSGVYLSTNKGGSYQRLTAGSDGIYTANIVPGNNILKVETSSGTDYQIVRGDRLQVSVSKIDGSSGNLIQAGDTVRVFLHGLHQPFPKLAGIYNPGFSDLLGGGTQHGAVHLNYTRGTAHLYGPGTQYDFITAANYVDVKIPEDAAGSVTLQDGYIGVGVFGRNNATGEQLLGSRSHRSGETAVFGDQSIQSYHTRSILPEVEIRLGAATENQAPVVTSKAVSTAKLQNGKNYAISNLGAWFTDPEGENLVYLVSVDGAAETGIQGSSYTYTASKEGTVKLTFRAFDGTLCSQPHTLTLTVTKADSGTTGSGTGTGSSTGSSSGTGTGTSGGTNVTPDSDTVEFGLKTSEIAGYVTVSFEDRGIRLEAEKATVSYPKPLGTIVSATKVPFKQGDSIADVTLRLLDERGIGYSCNNNGFYLAAIDNFEVNNTRYGSMGEFDAGSGSGWMITWNDWFIDQSASAFKVKDGDVIRWQYTCQLGKDIGDPFYGDSLNGSQNGTQNGTNDTDGAVTEVENLIRALPEKVTEAQKDQVIAASKAYDALTAAQKAKIDSDLVKKLEQAKQELGNATTTAAQKREAQSVKEQIAAIGVPVTLADASAIREAREAYDALTEEQKLLVDNYDRLMAAEQALAELETPLTPEEIYRTTGDYLENLGMPYVGSIGGEWMVIGLIRSGREVPEAEAYTQQVLKYIQQNVNDRHQLHRAKSTENSRLILALTAMEKDPAAVAGENLLLGLTELEYLQYQGINGPIWALIAFDSGNYPVPEGNVTREKLINTILDGQLEDGGWALSGETGDSDMTGMALQALAPYYTGNIRVKSAVNKALDTLSAMQNPDGTFASVDGPSAESSAQVVVALTALGIDPDTDERFVKNGNSAWDVLMRYYIPGGGFCHVAGGELDGMATEQAYYAMTAYYRMKEGKTRLYDMTDIIDRGGDPVTAEQTEPSTEETTEGMEEAGDNRNPSNNGKWVWMGVLGVCACALAAILLNWKRILAMLGNG